MSRVSVGVLALLLAAPAAGCSGASTGTPAPSAPASPTASTSATSGFTIRIDRPVSTSLDVAQAGPAAFRAKPTGTTVDPRSDPHQGYLALESDGSLLSLRTPAEPAGSKYDRLTRVSTLGLLKGDHFRSLATSSRETQGTLAGRARQVTAATEGDGRLLWVETASTDLEYSEWSIRSLDLHTHAIREIAHSPVLRHGYRLLDVDGGTFPVVVGDHVYWATAVPKSATPDPNRKADWEFDIERTPLTGPAAKPEVVARNAVMPAAAGSTLVYATYQAQTPDVYEIHQLTPGAHPVDRVLVRGYRSGTSWITNLAASGRLVVWTAQSPSLAKEGWVDDESVSGALFVLDTGTGQVTRVRTRNDAGAYASIGFTRRGVVWGNGSGSGDAHEYVLDIARGTIVRLGAYHGFSEVLANPATDTVMWATSLKQPVKILWMRGTLA